MIKDNFRLMRERRQLTQKQIADLMGVSQSLIGQIEIGLKIPSVPIVLLAAHALDCTTDELIKS